MLFVLPLAIIAAAPLVKGEHSVRRDHDALERQVASARAASLAADAAMIQADWEVARQRSADYRALQAARYAGKAQPGPARDGAE
jgi:hypothetical protein